MIAVSGCGGGGSGGGEPPVVVGSGTANVSKTNVSIQFAILEEGFLQNLEKIK